jgi:hypothetical protein
MVLGRILAQKDAGYDRQPVLLAGIHQLVVPTFKEGWCHPMPMKGSGVHSLAQEPDHRWLLPTWTQPALRRIQPRAIVT